MFDVTGGAQGRRNVCLVVSFSPQYTKNKLLYFAVAVWLISVCYHLGKGTTDLYKIWLCRAT